MSAAISVYGSSDDLVEFEGEGEVRFLDEESRGSRLEAEYYLGSGDKSTFLVEGSEGDQAYIYAYYEGCWHFSVGLVEEDIPIPAGWAVSIGQSAENGYSAELKIRAMDRLRVKEVKG